MINIFSDDSFTYYVIKLYKLRIGWYKNNTKNMTAWFVR